MDKQWAQSRREFWEKAYTFALPASLARQTAYGSSYADAASEIADAAVREWEIRFPSEEDDNVPEFMAFSALFSECRHATRVYNCLCDGGLIDKNTDLVKVGQLSRMSKAEILRLKNLGTKSLNQIFEALEARGIRLK